MNNPFLYIHNFSKQYLENKVNSITLFDNPSIYVINYLHPRWNLMILIYNKEPKLFKDKRIGVINEERQIEYEKLYQIDVNSFKDDNINYKTINGYLRKGRNFSNIFNYNKCKAEVEEINTILKNKENSSDVIDGL